MTSKTNQFAFILGREHEIALAELKAVLERFCFYFPARNATHNVAGGDIYRITGNTVFANIDANAQDVSKLADILGGTIKIYRIIDSLQSDISAQLSELIYSEKKNATSKFNFGISNFNKNLRKQQINSFAIEAKKSLKGKLSLRYVESRESAELSSILTLKNNLLGRGLEIAIFEDSIGILIGFSNPEEWSKRDYDKPASDKYSGMLPPKLARMMINITLGESNKLSNYELRISNQSPNDQSPNSLGIRNSDLEINDRKTIVIDPFCGSGSVLLEAMMLGIDVIGSDVSEKAVNDSKLNCDWLTTNYQLPPNIYQVFQADATSAEFVQHLKQSTMQQFSNLTIVAEPYLGEPKKFKPSYIAAEGEYSKIKELYLKFLEKIANYSSSLSRSSQPCKQDSNNIILCLVFPLVETTDKGQFSLYKKSVDEIMKLGYTQLRDPFLYGRDYQVVKREVVLLKLEQKDTRNKIQ